MAFSFGTAAPAASPFGGGGLFGAPAAPAGSSAPATGSAFSFGGSSAPAFGTTATNAFGAPAAGQASAPAASPFGAAPAAPAANPFSAPTAAPTLGTTAGTGLFGQPASAPATSNALVPAGTGLFGAPAAQPAQAQAQAQAASQARPGGLNYKTKFEELPPQMQQELQKIQQEVSAYRDECKALEADSRLHDTVSIKQSLDSETAALRQTLQSLHQAAVAEDEALMGFRERVMVLLRSTESAIRLYQRSKLWRELSAAAGQLPGGAAGGAGGAGAGGGGGSQLLASQAVADQISQPVQLPNPYLGLAVRGFSEALEQYHRCISELERVMTAAGGAGGGLMGGGGAGGGAGDDAAAVAALPTLVSHMHDYFVHVAARLERLHGEVGRAREAYLAARRARGDFGDPFADARPLHHMSKSGVNPKSAHPGGGANNGGGTFYSFGGPATAAGNGAGGLGGMGGLGGAAGAGGAPGTPGAAGPGVGGGAGASGGGLFGMSPGPLGGGGASPFGAAGVGVGAFGTPLLGAASAQQPQQQRVSAGRAGSSSNKKR